MFQSLGRDSVCSYSPAFSPDRRHCWFQSLGRDSVCSYLANPLCAKKQRTVSIPRSGFCLFILQRRTPAPHLTLSFNPSVGILFVHTQIPRRYRSLQSMFQSLGRDSVCSYRAKLAELTGTIGVSIPRSGFCLFIQNVSKPRLMEGFGFNPSVGILFVHTPGVRAGEIPVREFQSLGRDSVCSYPPSIYRPT